MNSSKEKGDALEAAVRAVETAILRDSPSLREKTFTIENKKIIQVSGVRHEIDLYVAVDIAAGYKAIYIFECKNLKTSVSKNDVIAFSEKIAVTNAQKGFFVAKSFSRYAESQAKTDERIQLLSTSEHNSAVAPAPFDHFHHIIRDRSKVVPSIAFHMRREATDTKDKWLINIQMAKVLFRGKPLDLESFAKEWIEQLSDRDVNCFQSWILPEDVYERTAEERREFGADEFLLDERPVQSISLRITHKIEVVRPPIVSHFEVATRGRVITFAPVQVGFGGSLQVSIVSHN
ncbi:MAG TPA: restriction endonuclease [Rhizomicrobium sp.]|jgi:hypothetical protein|nr:restriction endonuclease [Rhizomicrobium sp.]